MNNASTTIEYQGKTYIVQFLSGHPWYVTNVARGRKRGWVMRTIWHKQGTTLQSSRVRAIIKQAKGATA